MQHGKELVERHMGAVGTGSALREFREHFPQRQALSTVRAKGWGVRKGTTISDSRS